MPKQRFHTADVVRLQIERDPLPGEYLNLIDNPDGRNPDGQPGAWGWITPTPGATMRGVYVLGTHWLEYRCPPGGFDNYALSETANLPAAATTIAVAYRQYPGQLFTRAALTFYDDMDGGWSETTPFSAWSDVAEPDPIVVDIPTEATRVLLNLEYASTSSGTPPPSVNYSYLTDVTMVAYVGEPTPVGAPYSHDVVNDLWYDLSDDTGNITINRYPADVSTLTAIVGSTALDPTTGNDLIRIGRRIQALAFVNGGLAPIFTGTTGRPTVAYELRKRHRKAIITIPATNAWTALAAAPITAWTESPAVLPRVLEGLGLPWSIDGDGGQYPAPTWAGDPDYVGDGTAADNVIAVRDLTHGYTWIDGSGILNLTTPDHAPAGATRTCDESEYDSDITPTYGDDLINSVTINRLRGTTQETYGPIEHATSIAANGRAPATFTVVSTSDSFLFASDFGAYVLARNSNPIKGIDGVTIQLATLAQLDKWAAIEHYDLVTVTNDDSDYADTLRVASIQTEITGNQYLIGLTFIDPDRIPVPTTT